MRPTPDFVLATTSRSVNREHVYGVVADLISRQPDHLAELVRLMTEIQRRGVNLSPHWRCLTEALIFDELK